MTARISMKKVREIVRLKFEKKLSHHKIANSLNVSSSTVSDCLRRFKKANLTWPLDEGLDDETLISMLYKERSSQVSSSALAIDWSEVRRKLTRKNVTKQLLWDAYKEAHPNGLSYSRYCAYYRQWCDQLDVDMRQVHKAGEKLFVDYSGITMSIVVDNRTGETRKAEIFVATLGASNYIYAEATWTQNSQDWQASHKRTFEYLGGVPEILVPDNLKSGVTKASYYDPDINSAYHHLATYYGTTVLPTRVRSPKDKAKVEQAVQHVERRILAKLQELRFFSLAELNGAIKPLLEELNAKPFQKLPGSRKSEFEAIDKPHLKPLPSAPYGVAIWKNVTIARDYHLSVDNHYYSVPYRYHQKKCQLRYTDTLVEIYYGTKRVAAHPRQDKPGNTTLKQHMPKNHQIYAEWTQEKMLQWAQQQSVAIAEFIERLRQESDHEEKGLRAGSGIKRLCKDYGVDRVTAACRRALLINAYEYRSVKWILKENLDRLPLPQAEAEDANINHNNVRGGEYFE